jgi:MSHA biogenesis protein MshI
LPRIADAAFDRLGLRRRGARQGAGAVVLERADSGLRALRVSHPDGQPNVTAATSLPGVPVRDALSRLARDGWFDDGRVRVMLGAGQRHAVLMPRPDVEDAELVDAMRWQLADKLPYPGEQAVLDVLTIDDHESRTRQQVMVMAAERSALHALLEPVLRLRGQRIEWVDVLDCAQRNLVEAACGPAACVACVTERDGALLFTVSRGRDLVYSRVIEAVADGRDGEMPIERMGLQLQRAIDTIERRSPESAPVRILVGPSASDASPLRAVAEQCGLPVVPLDWAACADIAPAALEGIEGDPGLLMLLGAALRAVQEETHVG